MLCKTHCNGHVCICVRSDVLINIGEVPGVMVDTFLSTKKVISKSGCSCV